MDLATLTPDPTDLARCVHCGLCLPNCPTYLLTGYEAESPRGRVHLIQAYNAGRIQANAAYQQRILTSPNGAWKQMEDRGSPTANHMDHVHVNYRG